MITSGLGRIYPKGVLLGTVVEVKHKSYELFKTAVLEPSINFDQIEEVFVIIRSHTQPQGPLVARHVGAGVSHSGSASELGSPLPPAPLASPSRKLGAVLRGRFGIGT